MNDPDHHELDLSPDWLPDDATIDAIVEGREVDARFDHLVAFARDVRALGDEPAPAPTAELQAILRPEPTREPTGERAPGRRRRTAALAKVAGLGVAAKIGLGASLAAAGVAAAGAGGALPEPATTRVRGAIEEITPIDFDDPPPSHGRTSPGGTGHRGDPAHTTTTSGSNGRPGSAQTDDHGVAQPPDPSGNNGRRAHGHGGTPDADDSTTTEATTGENAPGASDNRQRNGNGHGRPHDTTTTGQTTTTEASQHPSATAPGRIKHTTTTSATPD